MYRKCLSRQHSRHCSHSPGLSTQGVRSRQTVRVKVSCGESQSTSHRSSVAGTTSKPWWSVLPASSVAAAILVSCSPFLPAQASAATLNYGLTTEKNVQQLPPIPTTFEPLPELTLPAFTRVGATHMWGVPPRLGRGSTIVALNMHLLPCNLVLRSKGKQEIGTVV